MWICQVAPDWNNMPGSDFVPCWWGQSGWREANRGDTWLCPTETWSRSLASPLEWKTRPCEAKCRHERTEKGKHHTASGEVQFQEARLMHAHARTEKHSNTPQRREVSSGRRQDGCLNLSVVWWWRVVRKRWLALLYLVPCVAKVDNQLLVFFFALFFTLSHILIWVTCRINV